MKLRIEPIFVFFLIYVAGVVLITSTEDKEIPYKPYEFEITYIK